MRWPSVITMLGLATGHAFGACAYAGRDLGAGTLASVDSERDTAGTWGVVYMNRIAPGGSDATPLMSNQTRVMDYYPSWSPDGNWIVFTSERRADGQSNIYRIRTNGSSLETLVSNDSFEDSGALSPDETELAYVLTGKELHCQCLEWTGHGGGTGWEHTQTLSIYVPPDGSDLRQIVSEDGYSLGSPSWSIDGSHILYNRITRENTYAAHGTASQMAAVASQILSVDVATGTDIVNHTSGDYLKANQHYFGNSSNIGYLIKGADRELFSWDSDWNYRFMDVFPQLHNATGRMATTQKQLGNSSVIVSSTHYTDLVDVYATGNSTELGYIEAGLSGAFSLHSRPMALASYTICGIGPAIPHWACRSWI
ncbi:putative Dipeptidylpeptidase IV N-terminal domain-containing protein [Seiridium cardinale]